LFLGYKDSLSFQFQLKMWLIQTEEDASRDCGKELALASKKTCFHAFLVSCLRKNSFYLTKGRRVAGILGLGWRPSLNLGLGHLIPCVGLILLGKRHIPSVSAISFPHFFLQSKDKEGWAVGRLPRHCPSLSIAPWVGASFLPYLATSLPSHLLKPSLLLGLPQLKLSR
jgi:hypothetical protein